MDRKDESIDMQLARIEAKLDKLIPEVRDVSKCIVSMRESMSKAQPSNHGRIGKMPRKQPKKKERNPLGNKRTPIPMQDGYGRILSFS